MPKTALLVINFGGPRSLEEVSDFLTALLTDEDVIRTPFPSWMQNLFFKRVARKRSEKVAHDYAGIGGKSPIFEDTEWMAQALGQKTDLPFYTFHRYLQKTHASFINSLEELQAEEILVFPLFPQFSYATTGSVARFFSKHLSRSTLAKMKWIPSYFADEAYVDVFCKTTEEFLQKEGLKEEETAFVFSAHGLPESFIQGGDPYQNQCKESFAAVSKKFPKALSLLTYQSQFGRAKWIKPSTKEICAQVPEWIQDKKQIVFLPLSFTSDHIETLFEIEQEYVKPLRDLGFRAYRCPALGRDSRWVDAAVSILQKNEKVENHSLIRR